MDINLIGIILSSTLLATLITSIITFVRERKKDYIYNIIKERKDWRDAIRSFSKKVNKCNSIKELRNILPLLKVYINPYGKCFNNILYDPYMMK